MKLIEKILERIGAFSPMIIFVLLCILYLSYFEDQPSDPEPTKKEIKAAAKKTETDNEMQSYWLFRD